ncbi:conserved hypothetical protein [Nitrobacter winogradskyi Nb-255]|uniref:Cytochrome c oxidase assembly protein n=2 Tax=Nitrobacter winogradskyi TaxID=913 RepID=Q3SQ76_NITWN|nr:conserved hypothetical protein [Nitrobacter winogradskyi Nb-255]
MRQGADPYCGPAPLPEDLASSWNFDPLLIAVFAGVAAACMMMSRERRIAALKSPAALAGWAVLLAAFVSPLCALASALFSARVFHHVLLVALAAPLFALAFPPRATLRRVPVSGLVLIHAICMWVWHTPGPYAFALDSTAAYWMMEASLFLSAFLLWQAVLDRRNHAGAALAALLATVIQMGMLGALLTFAARPLFDHHMTTTLPYGLTPLDDQQLAGLLMWIPASMSYLAAAALLAARMLETHPHPTQSTRPT